MDQRLLGTVAAVAIVTALSGPALAADLTVPVRRAPPPAPVVVNWSGFYLGGHVGYGWASFREGVLSTFGSPDDLPLGNMTASGLALGLHAGYNWQLGPAPWGSWLVGIEGDASITPGWQKSRCTLTDGASCTDRAVSSQVDWLASLRGRLGMTFDRTLIYATGGVAWAKTRHTACVTDTCIDRNGVKTGGVVGGGIEWKYNPNLSLRFEGLHYMFNENRTDFVDCCSISATQGLRNVTVFRVGASWHPQMW